MKVILDIKDSKADFIMELLKGFSSYVKTKPLTPMKAKIVEDLAASAKEVRMHKEGKTSLKSADELLNEL